MEHKISITSQSGIEHYYDHFAFCRGTADKRDTPCRMPTLEDAKEFIELRKKFANKEEWVNRLAERKAALRLRDLEQDYDWRDKIANPTGTFKGLFSPDDKALLPTKFFDILPQSMSLLHKNELSPVSNGEGFGLITLGTAVMLTPFKYNNIVTERWERQLYFVQDNESSRWGVLRYHKVSTRGGRLRVGIFDTSVWVLDELLPCIADEIFEDEICTDCSPTLFWAFRKADKYGIITPFGHTEPVFDSYETDWENCQFILRKGDKTVRMSYSLEEVSE